MSVAVTLGTPPGPGLARLASQQYARDKVHDAAQKARHARVDHAQKVMDSAITRCRKCDRRVLPMVPGHECRRRSP